MKLNDNQQVAVNHMNGPLLVTSCPGSGKTTTLVERVIRLINKGVNPKNIICLTFTNKAAKEMKERICNSLDNNDPGFFIGTFHALCATILRKVGKYVGYTSNFNIMDSNDQIDLILQISRKMEMDVKRGDAYLIAYWLNYYREQREDIEYVRDKLKIGSYFDIIEKYIEACENNNVIDFSGLIYKTIQLLDNNDTIREKIQNNFQYILVDEAQDANQSQFYLVNLFGDKWKNIMLICDPDQSIYKWRGSRYQNIQDFLYSHSNCKTVVLAKNYRSTPEIVKVASTLIKHNSSHINKKFETDNKNGESVKCRELPSQMDEAQWVSDKIHRLIIDEGWSFNDICVLYRMNKMSEPIEQSLAMSNIPYEVVGGWNFYDRKEIKDCLSMLKFLSNKKDGIAFHRICSLVKGMGNVTIGQIENKAIEKGINLIEACQSLQEESNSVRIKSACKKICDIYKNDFNFSNPARCMALLVNEFGIEKHLIDKYGNEAVDRIDNVKQIIEAASVFNNQGNGVEKYLQQISLVTTNDKEVDGNKVSLMTLHAAKGLEFPIVFMIGVEQNILPHVRALYEDPVENLEEERRLAYVGMTRAEKKLYITYCKNRRVFDKYGGIKFNRANPSQFLIEAGLIGERNF